MPAIHGTGPGGAVRRLDRPDRNPPPPWPDLCRVFKKLESGRVGFGRAVTPAAAPRRLLMAERGEFPKTAERWFSVPAVSRPIYMPVDTYAS